MRTRKRPLSPPDCASGTYTCATLPRSRPNCRTSPTTPTTVAHVAPLSNDTRVPIGSRPSQYRVIALLTIATAGASARSAARHARRDCLGRPPTNGIPSV